MSNQMNPSVFYYNQQSELIKRKPGVEAANKDMSNSSPIKHKTANNFFSSGDGTANRQTIA